MITPTSRAQHIFIEFADDTSDWTRSEAGCSVVRKIETLRFGLNLKEREFDRILKAAAARIKFISSLSDEMRESLVLSCIEESHAHTVSEIAADTTLSEHRVKIIVAALEGREILFERLRIMPGKQGVRQQEIFSLRKPCSCVL